MLVLVRDTATVFVPSSAPVAVAPALGRAFDAACRVRSSESERTLRDATAALVDRLKANALPPERVVVAVKAALAKYGNMHNPPSLVFEPDDADGVLRAGVYRLVFAWCLDEYFRQK